MDNFDNARRLYEERRILREGEKEYYLKIFEGEPLLPLEKCEYQFSIKNPDNIKNIEGELIGIIFIRTGSENIIKCVNILNLEKAPAKLKIRTIDYSPIDLSDEEFTIMIGSSGPKLVGEL